MTQFVVELRALAMYCNFGASSTDLLRDCIVCGINDDHVQRLLSEKALTFEKALELAVCIETAKKCIRIAGYCNATSKTSNCKSCVLSMWERRTSTGQMQVQAG